MGCILGSMCFYLLQAQLNANQNAEGPSMQSCTQSRGYVVLPGCSRGDGAMSILEFCLFFFWLVLL